MRAMERYRSRRRRRHCGNARLDETEEIKSEGGKHSSRSGSFYVVPAFVGVACTVQFTF